MDYSLPSVTIIHAGEVRHEPVSPDGIIQAPYATGLAILGETPVVIRSKDAEEGASRGLPVHEAVFARIKTVGPNGGEVWHTHMSYYDILFYILSGKATMWWEADGERHQADFGVGDFVHMSPRSWHQWLNTGSEDPEAVAQLARSRLRQKLPDL